MKKFADLYEPKNLQVVSFPTSSSDNLPDDDSNPELSDFQRLLLIRTLRADRLEPALRVYVEQHIEGTPMHEVSGAIFYNHLHF